MFLFRFRVTITFKGGVIQLHSCFVLVYTLDRIVLVIEKGNRLWNILMTLKKVKCLEVG